MSPFLTAIIACAIAASAEGLFAGRDANKVIASYRQPGWAPPIWSWYIIGLAYYGACFLAVYRLMLLDASRRWPALGLVFAVMAANAVWNLLFFRLKDLRLSLWFNIPYSVLLGIMMWQLMAVDRRATLIFWVYVAYLPYAATLGYFWWKMNPKKIG